MSDTALQILVQGGLASVALVSLYFNYRLISNHFHENSEAMNKLENAIIKLTQFLEDKMK